MKKTTPQKKKTGPVSRYKDEYAHQAYVICKETGVTDVQLARVFGVCKKTLATWKNEHPEFKEQIQAGKDEFDVAVAESCLMKRIKGYKYTEVTSEPDLLNQGKLTITKKVTKHIPSDPTSTIFFLKNRNSSRWRDTKNIEGGLGLTMTHEEALKQLE